MSHAWFMLAGIVVGASVFALGMNAGEFSARRCLKCKNDQAEEL